MAMVRATGIFKRVLGEEGQVGQDLIILNYYQSYLMELLNLLIRKGYGYYWTARLSGSIAPPYGINGHTTPTNPIQPRATSSSSSPCHILVLCLRCFNLYILLRWVDHSLKSDTNDRP